MNATPASRGTWAALSLGIASYAVCLGLKGVCAEGNLCGTGYDILALGIRVIRHGTLTAPALLANPMLWAAWILLAAAATWNRGYRPALIVASVAMILALSCLIVPQISVGGSRPARISVFAAGYWIWIFSIGCVIGGSLRGAMRTSSSSPP